MILYGNEENWDKEEKERMIGDHDAFGKRKEVEEGEEANKDDVVIECLDENEENTENVETKGLFLNAIN